MLKTRRCLCLLVIDSIVGIIFILLCFFLLPSGHFIFSVVCSVLIFIAMQLTGEAAKTYTRNMEGWRDSFNFADLVLREIEGAEYIAGHRLVKEQGIKFGLFTEDGNIWDYYPYWHNWISFTLEAGVSAVTPKQYEDLL